MSFPPSCVKLSFVPVCLSSFSLSLSLSPFLFLFPFPLFPFSLLSLFLPLFLPLSSPFLPFTCLRILSVTLDRSSCPLRLPYPSHSSTLFPLLSAFFALPAFFIPCFDQSCFECGIPSLPSFLPFRYDYHMA